VYAREVDGRVLSFGVSGMLFRDGLVMYDRQTETLWTQVDGRAIKGPLAGKQLTALPAIHATWKEWKTLYPRSLVLKKRGEFRTPYESYNRSSQLGILGRRLTDRRLPGKERILGIRTAEAATAFPISAVRRAGLVQEQVGALPVVLVAAAAELPVVAFDRRVGERVLTFAFADRKAATIRDHETGTVWRLADGTALEGPLKGTRLVRVAAHPAFWFGWRSYFPHSEVWQPANPPR
jgi:hypothetical protein